MRRSTFLILLFAVCVQASAQPAPAMKRPLYELQKDFVELKFGMFIHFNIATFMNHDWPDPEASPSVFNPSGLDCEQWAQAARSANMRYGCLTTKHHNGFCLWDTKTTDYSVMSSPLKKDVVKEFVAAFRRNGLKVMLYYSILDVHHKLRPNEITPAHVTLVKKQITELLTNYGEVQALIIDGWDAPWSRISYDEIPFAEIYRLVKFLQPNCLLMDLNGSKYPSNALYYTDIKTYEMGAGQRVSQETNTMPALACLPINTSWFWKTDFPQKPVRDPEKLVSEILVPLNKVNCNFILNVAPNRDGRFDENALAALKTIGQRWKNDQSPANFPDPGLPVISSNLAKNKPANSSWSDDMDIMDFANDDNFRTSWRSNPDAKDRWFEVDLTQPRSFNTVTIFEEKSNIRKYKIESCTGGTCRVLFEGENASPFKVHRFASVTGDKVKISIQAADSAPSIAELGVYNEP